MGNGDIGSDKPNLGGPNSVPGGDVIEARPQLTEEELKVWSYHSKLEWLQDYLNHCTYVKWSLKLIFLQSIQEKNEREEAERKKRIQLYVFILRSVAYPFNAKQPSDMSKRHLKVTKDGHDKMKAKIEVSLTLWTLSIIIPFFL